MTADENRSSPGPTMSGGWSSLLLTLRFATELATMAVLAWAAASAGMALAGDGLAAAVYAVVAIGTAILLRAVMPGS